MINFQLSDGSKLYKYEFETGKLKEQRLCKYRVINKLSSGSFFTRYQTKGVLVGVI